MRTTVMKCITMETANTSCSELVCHKKRKGKKNKFTMTTLFQETGLCGEQSCVLGFGLDNMISFMLQGFFRVPKAKLLHGHFQNLFFF